MSLSYRAWSYHNQQQGNSNGSLGHWIDLLDDVGPHLVLALRVFVAAPASVLLQLLALGAAGVLRQLLLIDTQLRSTHRGQVTWGKWPRNQAGLPGFHFSMTS